MVVSSEARGKLGFDPIVEARARWMARWPESERMAASAAVIRVGRIAVAAVELALSDFDLTFTRYEALLLLAFSRQGRLPLGKIGTRLHLHPTTVTNVIDRLEQQAFVRRTADPRDRRATLAEITAEGLAVVDTASHAVSRTQFGLGVLGEEELTELSQILVRVREAARDFRVE